MAEFYDMLKLGVGYMAFVILFFDFFDLFDYFIIT